jgi:hypothetical protein
MGTGRKYQKKPMTRPTKTPGNRARRQRTQKRRLIALGMDEAEVERMDAKTVRELLKRPAKIKAMQMA